MCDIGLGTYNWLGDTVYVRPILMFEARMRDLVERGILISQENLGKELSKPRYWVNPRRSTQSDLWTPSKLAEFRASKNPEEEANRSSQDVSRDHKESRKTRPCRIG